MLRYKIRLFIILILFAGLYSCKSSKNSSSSTNTATTSTRTKSNPAVDKTINTARAYNGTKYKYGGDSKKGIDCSGLVCRAFESVDVTMPRTSSAQSTMGKRIYIGEIQPGDLIFFATGSSKKKITHVGLVTEVTRKHDIKFIHATTKSGVREDWLSSPYYKSRYVKAVRVFN